MEISTRSSSLSLLPCLSRWAATANRWLPFSCQFSLSLQKLIRESPFSSDVHSSNRAAKPQEPFLVLLFLSSELLAATQRLRQICCCNFGSAKLQRSPVDSAAQIPLKDQENSGSLLWWHNNTSFEVCATSNSDDSIRLLQSPSRDPAAARDGHNVNFDDLLLTLLYSSLYSDTTCWNQIVLSYHSLGMQ